MHRSHSLSSRSQGKPHPKKNPRVKVEDPHTDYYSSDDHYSDSPVQGRGGRSFKLNKPSPSSDSHEQGGIATQEQVTVALIMDCPTITIHTVKCYKALIDSGAAISLIRYSTHQLIDDSFKTPIQPTTTKLNIADGLPMMALGVTALHLRIVDFKFTHNFIICNRLPHTEIIFGIDVQKKCSLYIQRDGKFLTYTRNYEQ